MKKRGDSLFWRVIDMKIIMIIFFKIEKLELGQLVSLKNNQITFHLCFEVLK